MPWKRDTPGCPCCGQTPCIVTMTCDDDNGTTDCCSTGNEGPCCISIRIEGLTAGAAYCVALNETKVCRNFDATDPLQWGSPSYQHTFTAPDSYEEFQLIYLVEISGAGGSATQVGTVQLHRNGGVIVTWTKTLATGTNRTDCSAWSDEEHTLASSTGACVATGSKAYVTSLTPDCDPRWFCGCLPDGGYDGGGSTDPDNVEIEVDIPAGFFNNSLGSCGEVLNGTTVSLAQFTEGTDSNHCSWRLAPVIRVYFRMYLEEISETQCKATFAIYLGGSPTPGAYLHRHLYTYTFNKTSPMSIAGSPYTFAYASSDGVPTTCDVPSPNTNLSVSVVAS